MISIFKSKKREKIARLEKKLHIMVDKKEKRIQAIDEHGRDIVMTLSDYLGDVNLSRKIGHRKLIALANRYIRENQHYFI